MSQSIINTPDISLIIERLKMINPYKIILFGSYAYGKPENDSDIDLMIVTDDDYFPGSYKEKSDIYLKVSNALTDLSKKMPIDLIVYTKPMYNKFNELGSLFSKEILQKGIILYETNN
ncbi:Nucleotidyltransferase domain-containing protein [Candidatus Magnetomoraceae bacterium gMMP-15]